MEWYSATNLVRGKRYQVQIALPQSITVPTKEVSKRVLHTYSQLNLCLLKLSMLSPPQKSTFSELRYFTRGDLLTGKPAGKVLHSSRSFGSLAPRCWNGARLRNCRHLAAVKTVEVFLGGCLQVKIRSNKLHHRVVPPRKYTYMKCMKKNPGNFLKLILHKDLVEENQVGGTKHISRLCTDLSKDDV